MPNATFAVVGAGSWGTALAITLARNNNSVKLWDHDTQHIQAIAQHAENKQYLPGTPLPVTICAHTTLAETIKDTDAILIVVPSHAMRSVLEQIKPLLKATQGICLATKGLEAKTGALLHDVVHDILGDHPLAILTGPSFAKEVALGMHTALTLASTDDALQQSLLHALSSEQLRVYLNHDIIGAELGGVVKNVLAIATGIADGLGTGANARAALITRGLAEMLRLGKALGAKQETLIGLGGLGDLILTCSDNQSRNRRFGVAIGQGQSQQQALDSIGQVVEGLRNSEELHLLAERLHVNMPICNTVYAILYQGLSPQQALIQLMQRDNHAE